MSETALSAERSVGACSRQNHNRAMGNEWQERLCSRNNRQEKASKQNDYIVSYKL